MSILATTSFPGISRTRSPERESGRKDPWEPDCTDFERFPWLSKRTGSSVEDGARKSISWLDQWQTAKLGTGSCVQSFSRAFPSSTNVPVLLLNISLINLKLSPRRLHARAQENSKVWLNPEQSKCFEFEGVLNRLALSDVLPLLGQE